MSPEKIENKANELWIHIHSTFNGNSRSLVSTTSQRSNKNFQEEASSREQLDILQSFEDPDWKELMSDTSHHVIQILLAIMNNHELGAGLVFVPWINTTPWTLSKDNWLFRSTPTTRPVDHIPLVSNLPLHTDSLTSEFHDEFNDAVVWTLIHGIKHQPTSYFYLWEKMPEWDNNSTQAMQIAEILWYDAWKLRECKGSIQKEIDAIMKKTPFPQIDFKRHSKNAGFSIQAWISYIDSSTQKSIQNPIAHTWYLPSDWAPTWHLRLIKQRDINSYYRPIF